MSDRQQCSDLGVVLWRLTQLERLMQQVHEQAKLTNGRLGELERWRARAEGMLAAWHWLTPVASGVMSAVATAAVIKLLGI